MRIIRLRNDDTLSLATARLRLSMVHYVSDDEAYIAQPGTTALQRTYPLFGFLGRIFKPRYSPVVGVLEGDGFPLAAQRGHANAYRFPVDPAEDYEDLVDDAAYWEGQRKQQKRSGKGEALPVAVMITMLLLAIPVVLMGLFAGLPALVKSIGGAS